jgi:dCTP deaminase
MTQGFPNKLVITPLLDPIGQLQPGAAAIDLRLGQEIITADQAAMSHLNPLEDQRDELAGYLRSTYLPLGGEFILHPRQFALAATLEYIRLPRGLAGHVVGRSRWARVGLIIAMATFVHPGYSGCLTLELQNLGDIPMRLSPGFTIAQLILEDVTWETTCDPAQLTCAIGPEFLNLLSDDERVKLNDLRDRHNTLTGDRGWPSLVEYEHPG